MNPRERFLEFVWRKIGMPYVWGGSDAEKGLDCSGLVIAGLGYAGLWPASLDMTAAGLHQRYSDFWVRYPYPGCLVFWRDPTSKRITHVEVCVGENDQNLVECVGARKSQGRVCCTLLTDKRSAELCGYADPFMKTENVLE